MPKPRKFPSLDSCQKRFLWTHKEVDLAPHPVVGLVLQVGDAEKFPQALSFEGLIPFLSVSYLERKPIDWVQSTSNFLVGPQEPLLATFKRQELV